MPAGSRLSQRFAERISGDDTGQALVNRRMAGTASVSLADILLNAFGQ